MNTAYTMEVAAPGLKKDMVKMNIDKDGYLNVSIVFNPFLILFFLCIQLKFIPLHYLY